MTPIPDQPTGWWDIRKAKLREHVWKIPRIYDVDLDHIAEALS